MKYAYTYGQSFQDLRHVRSMCGGILLLLLPCIDIYDNKGDAKF